MANYLDNIAKSKSVSATDSLGPIKNWLLEQEAKFNPKVFNPRSTDEGPRSLNMLRQEGPATDKSSNYWSTPVAGDIPLDQFVQLAGMGAKAIAPDEWSGRLGGDLQAMGAQASQERSKREYERPNVLLDRRVRELQVEDLERKIGEARTAAPEEWDLFYKSGKDQGLSDLEIVERWNSRDSDDKPKYHYTKGDNEVVVFEDGKEIDRVNLTPKEAEGTRIVKFDDGTASLVDDQGNEIKKFANVAQSTSKPSINTWVGANGQPVMQVDTEFFVVDPITKQLRGATPEETKGITRVPTGKATLGIDTLRDKLQGKGGNGSEGGDTPTELWRRFDF